MRTTRSCPRLRVFLLLALATAAGFGTASAAPAAVGTGDRAQLLAAPPPAADTGAAPAIFPWSEGLATPAAPGPFGPARLVAASDPAEPLHSPPVGAPLFFTPPTDASGPNATTSDDAGRLARPLRMALPSALGRGDRPVFSLPRAGSATLALYDISGRRVISRDLGWLAAGEHAIEVPELASLRPGVYWLRAGERGAGEVRKVVVMSAGGGR